MSLTASYLPLCTRSKEWKESRNECPNQVWIMQTVYGGHDAWLWVLQMQTCGSKGIQQLKDCGVLSCSIWCLFNNCSRPIGQPDAFYSIYLTLEWRQKDRTECLLLLALAGRLALLDDIIAIVLLASFVVECARCQECRY